RDPSEEFCRHFRRCAVCRPGDARADGSQRWLLLCGYRSAFHGNRRCCFHPLRLRFELLAEAFGPVFGGLFLAFPAIFPASITLIAKREREKKEQHGLSGAVRGRRAAALDAAGSVLGAIGLGCFAGVVWKALPDHGLGSVICAAGALWFVVSSCLWWLRKK